MAIYLIRHGETDYNAARVLQTPDVPLSVRGLAQARRLAERLAAAGIARILASDMTRAAMTARELHARTGAELEFDPVLHERNFGDLRGTPYKDLDFDPFAPDYEPPAGESWDAFHTRVERAFERVERLAAATEGHLAVVTHGLVCRAVVSRHMEIEEEGPLTVRRWGNTALTIAEGPDPWRVRLLACTTHLDDLEDERAEGGAA